MKAIYNLLTVLTILVIGSSTLFSQDLMQRAATAFKQKDYKQAAELYTAAIDKGTVQGKPYLWRGLSYFYSGDADKAIDDLKFYIESDKDNPDVNNVLGLLYYEIGNKNEAVAYFDNAINSDPNYAEAYINRGMCWAGLTAPALAKKDFDKALQIDPRNPYAYLQRAKLHHTQEKFDAATKDIVNAEKLGKRDSETYHVWGDILYSQGKYKDALAKYSKGLELEPDNIELLHSRAIAYNRDGRDNLANADLKKLESISGIDISTKEQSFKKIMSAKDVMKFALPDDWALIENRDVEGQIILHAVPSKYKSKPDISPAGVKFIYYTKLKETFKGKKPLEIVKDFEAETKFQGYGMHYYGIEKRKYKKYGGVDFSTYTIKSQNRPSDRPEILLKTITNLDDTILIGYMYSLETQFHYLEAVYERILNSIDFSENEYLRN